MTFNVAIVEDDETMKRQLTEYFERYTKETNVRFSISCFSDGDEICENFKCQFDVILLDIEIERAGHRRVRAEFRRESGDYFR